MMQFGLPTAHKLTFLSSPPVTSTRPDLCPRARQLTLAPCATNSSEMIKKFTWEIMLQYFFLQRNRKCCSLVLKGLFKCCCAFILMGKFLLWNGPWIIWNKTEIWSKKKYVLTFYCVFQIWMPISGAHKMENSSWSSRRIKRKFISNENFMSRLWVAPQ